MAWRPYCITIIPGILPFTLRAIFANAQMFKIADELLSCRSPYGNSFGISNFVPDDFVSHSANNEFHQIKNPETGVFINACGSKARILHDFFKGL